MDTKETHCQVDGYWESLLNRGKMVTAATALALLPMTGAEAAGTLRCSEGGCGYVNTAQLYQRNQMAHLRSMQQQQRLCNSIKSSGRTILWSGCR